jgi:tRNA dimethylallyltransferase
MTESQKDSPPRVVVVTGPTAAGKTAIAIDLALRFGGEIVNADSMQVYRFLDIGTAKPSPEERAQVAHHVIDVVTPNVAYNAARYLQDSREAAAAIHSRGKTVFLTGGTGLYIRVFLEGIVGDAAPDAELRARLEREYSHDVAAGDPERLHRRLAELDSGAAERIHPNDLRRIIRALEISQSGGLASARRRAHGFADRPFRVLHLAIDPGREVLNARIDERCREMIDAGLLQEVRGLRERGYGPELPPLQSIGYRHLAAVADGLDTLGNALEAMQRDTRRFARRQRTWLRGVPDARWVDPREPDAITGLVEAFISSENQ